MKRLTRITGFNIDVSSASGTDHKAQVRDALRFFKRHALELRRLRAAFPRAKPELDFSIWVTAPRETFTHSYWLPPPLLTLAAQYGVTIRFSFYPTQEEEAG